eukprot:12695956-Ditylum_brightwellii.AAC.1
MKARGCDVSNRLPGLWKSFKSWMYLIFIVVTIGKNSSGMDRHTTEGTSFMFPRHSLPVALQGNEGAITSSIEHDITKTSKELNINCNPDIQPSICMHGQLVALANESTTQARERYLFRDELMAIEFGLDNCCTNYVCYHKRLFKEMREAPDRVGIFGIGEVRKTEGTGTVVFQLTDSMGDVHQ